jgi:hypothetical protein
MSVEADEIWAILKGISETNKGIPPVVRVLQ